MQIFRFLVISLMTLGLMVHLGKTIYYGLKTGKIVYSTSSTYCQKSKHPIVFWLLVALFSVVIMFCGYAFEQIAKQTVLAYKNISSQ